MTGMVAKAAIAVTATVATTAAVFTAGLPAPQAAVPTTIATSGIPARYLTLYQHAAAVCPGLSWTVLAGVGEVESDHGRAPVLVSSAGARGPMQFEPATWSRYGGDGDGDGTADPFDPADAIPAAAAYLCSLGVTNDPTAALIAYNCGNTGTVCRGVSAGYAAQVLTWASRYGQVAAAAGPTATVAVRAALSQLGTRYLWGGDSPTGFDCSGLVQWAYARAGVALPRVAQDQYDTGPTLVDPAALVPGDLLFFGTGPRSVTHVGIYLGDGRFVDAPHTGAVVRVDILAGFTPRFVGATRPGQVAA
jgi:cell wall-associated NlpC family hydrolase